MPAGLGSSCIALSLEKYLKCSPDGRAPGGGAFLVASSLKFKSGAREARNDRKFRFDTNLPCAHIVQVLSIVVILNRTERNFANKLWIVVVRAALGHHTHTHTDRVVYRAGLP